MHKYRISSDGDSEMEDPLETRLREEMMALNAQRYRHRRRQLRGPKEGQRPREAESQARSALSGELGEVQRLRATEKTLLATRVKAAQDAYDKRFSELTKQYQQEVELLKMRTKAYIDQLHQESKSTLAQRSAALSVGSSPRGYARSAMPSPSSFPTSPAPRTPPQQRGLGFSFSDSPAKWAPSPSGTPRSVRSSAWGQDSSWCDSPNSLHRHSPRVLELFEDDE